MASKPIISKKHSSVKVTSENTGKLKQAAWILVFVALGIVTLSLVRAASPYVVVEAENSIVTTGASIIPDLSNGASGTGYVKFGKPPVGVTIPSPGTWTNITGNLSGHSSSCGSLGGLTPVPNSSAMLIGVGQYNMFKSASDNGVWIELGTGSGSAKVNNRPSQVVFDPTNSSIFYESGSYGPGVFKTTDGGITFKALGNVNHSDGMSVDFSDPARMTILAGAHEASQTVYKSSDGGNTWTNIGANLPGGTGFSINPYIINSSTYIVSTYPSWSGGSSGIYRTTNGGSSWTKVSTESGSQPAAILPNGTIVYPDGSSIVRSSDSGLTWTKAGSNLRSEVGIAALPDGKLLATNGNNKMVYSSDLGSTWIEFGPTMPFPNSPSSVGGVSSVTYSPANGAFYANHWDCGNSVASDSIWRLK